MNTGIIRQLNKYKLYIISIIIFIICFSSVVSVKPANAVILEDQYINIGEKGVYQLNISSMFEGEQINKITLNSKTIEDGIELKDCGDYSITVETVGKIYLYKLVLYYKGDVNLDGKRDVRDLIAARKMNTTSKKSALKSSDMNDDEIVNADDYAILRQCLINKLKKTYLFDFHNYRDGLTNDPSAYIGVNVEAGEEYTFSFSYELVGESGGTTIINAAKEWSGKSNVAFDSSPLNGKGIYSVTFTADSNSVIPVFQSNVYQGKPMLYVWNLSMVKKGTDVNLLENAKLCDFGGTLINSNLVTIDDMDVDRISNLGGIPETEANYKNVWKLDFTEHTETEKDITAFFSQNVEIGKEYEFSFDYCIQGEARNCTVINAPQLWWGTSKVEFHNNRLSREGTYKQEFVADCSELIPVFQQFAPQGKAILFIWNLKLVEKGQEYNQIEDLKVTDFEGDLTDKKLIEEKEIDINQLIPWGDLEPSTENTAILYNKQTSEYDENAEIKRQEIIGLKDTVEAASTKTKYYVSWRGNDNNDGKTPGTAWRSIAKINENAGNFQEGDSVLFERGGIYRGAISVTSGVSYGAYGTGSKPCIYGSLRNYAAQGLWHRTGIKNIWALETNLNNIGNIIFDEGVKVGTKQMYFTMKNDLDFYHDEENAILYLYSENGNPGKRFKDIEIGYDVSIFKGQKDDSNVTIENLCIKYTGAHGIHFITGSKNITIKGCEIGYIGGSVMTVGERTVGYGNGIEVVDNCNGITVENNWIYQCYDAGITHQSSNPNGCKQIDINFSNNLVEYCCYNIEYYVDVNKGFMKNITYDNNILRFSGYGFGSFNRIGGDNSHYSNICNYTRKMYSDNFNIQNNIFDTPKNYQITVGSPNDGSYGPTITSNTYIQRGNEVAKVIMNDEVQILKASNLEELNEIIKYIDLNPFYISLSN